MTGSAYHTQGAVALLGGSDGLVEAVQANGIRVFRLERLDLDRLEREGVRAIAVDVEEPVRFVAVTKIRKDRRFDDVPVVVFGADLLGETVEQHKKLRAAADAYVFGDAPTDVLEALRFVATADTRGEPVVLGAELPREQGADAKRRYPEHHKGMDPPVRSARLRQVSDDRLVFTPTIGGVVFALFVIVFSLAFAVVSFLIAKPNVLFTVVLSGMGVTVAAFGVRGLLHDLTPTVFDKQAGLYYQGREPPGPGAPGEGSDWVRLEAISGVGTDFDGDLMLSLADGGTIQLPSYHLSEGKQIADFLGVPFKA